MYTFLISQVSEFNLCVSTDGMKLLPQGVLIIWTWVWEDEQARSEGSVESPDESESVNMEDDHYNPYMHSDSESDSESPFQLPSQTHIVTFKCIGTTHDMHAQEVLSKVSKLLKDDVEVPVKLVCEPENQYDSKAIAFMCLLSEQWHRIGYVVSEALDHVHKALADKKIIFVRFSWVKYIVIWRHSGPGYYAGINIAIDGEWPRQVTRVASTR